MSSEANGPQQDFPSSLYGEPAPPADNGAIAEAREEAEAEQLAVPIAEEVIDETEGQALRGIQNKETKLGDEAAKELYPGNDEQPPSVDSVQ